MTTTIPSDATLTRLFGASRRVERLIGRLDRELIGLGDTGHADDGVRTDLQTARRNLAGTRAVLRDAALGELDGGLDPEDVASDAHRRCDDAVSALDAAATGLIV